MKLVGLLAAALALVASTPVASRSLPLIPPDPVKLTAAQAMAATLPLDGINVDERLHFGQPITTIEAAVIAWLGEDVRAADGDFVTIVAGNARRNARQAQVGCLPSVSEKLAVSYSRLLTLESIVAATAFLNSPAGQDFARTNMPHPAVDLMTECVLWQLRGQLPSLLAEAEKSVKLMQQINGR